MRIVNDPGPSRSLLPPDHGSARHQPAPRLPGGGWNISRFSRCSCRYFPVSEDSPYIEVKVMEQLTWLSLDYQDGIIPGETLWPYVIEELIKLAF